jgi:hypothetical protein
MTPLRVMLVVAALGAPAAASPGIRDSEPHAPPEIALPRSGGSYVDPVFGTRITRVTDERDGKSCVHAYSYWPAMNLDSTRLLIACDNAPLLYRFDGRKLRADGRLEGGDGPEVQFEGASWSHRSPDVIYALDGEKLWRLDVSRRGARGAKVVRDFSDLVDDGVVVAHLTMSSDDRVFSFHTRDRRTGAHRDAFVYDAHSGKVRKFERGTMPINESKVSKSGRWVMVDGALGGWKMWEPESGKVLSFDPGDGEARPGGHADLGKTLIVNSDGWNTGLQVRGYGAPLGARNLVNIARYPRRDGEPNWSIADHVSLRADSEAFVVASTYGGDGSFSAFEDEIYLAYTDGSGTVRLAHTRSTEANPDPDKRYWAQPRAVIDREGRWVVWTSDLGSSSRTDVLMLEIPAELRPAPPPPPPAPPPTVEDEDDDEDEDDPADPPPPATPAGGDGPVLAGGADDDGVDALTGGCSVGRTTRGSGHAGWLLVAWVLARSSRRRA